MNATGRLPEVMAALVERFGPVDLVSPWFAFDYTDYYTAEMGHPLSRRMASFVKTIDPADLAEVKHATHDLESRWARDGKRGVNIDPGYLAPSRFVLATGKDHAHRIYLAAGVYADLTLLYRKGGFVCLPWTYPDYAGSEIQAFLSRVRHRYLHPEPPAPAADDPDAAAAGQGKPT